MGSESEIYNIRVIAFGLSCGFIGIFGVWLFLAFTLLHFPIMIVSGFMLIMFTWIAATAYYSFLKEYTEE